MSGSGSLTPGTETLSRREFLARGSATTGVLIVALHIPLPLNAGRRSGDAMAAGAAGGEGNAENLFEANAWLKISATGTFIFVLDRSEMGQGVMTALPMLFGEEFDLDPRRFSIEQAPADRRYDNPDLSLQVTGGSTSVHASWGPLRQAGADLRLRFVKAAARQWGVQVAQCRTENGEVITGAGSTEKRLTYGALVEKVRTEEADDAPLKSPAEYRYIGRDFPRLENLAKVTGTAVFGIDVVPNDVKIAVLIRPPRLGAKVKSFETKDAAVMAGVEKIFSMPDRDAIAVVGRSYWHVSEAAAKVVVEWSDGHAELDSETLREQFSAAIKKGTKKAAKSGNIDDALVNAPLIIEEEYELPFLAHGTMEPQNCTAFVSSDRCEVWAPTQSPALAHAVALRETGLTASQVLIHTTLLGGGFGRRLAQDYVREAVQVAKIVKGTVKVVWSREDDMRHSPYRPASLHRLRGAVDNGGKIIAWEHRIGSQSILAQLTPEWAPAMMPGWVPGFVKKAAGSIAGWAMSGRSIDDTAVEGAKEIPYGVGAFYVGHAHVEPGIPVGFWRSVGHSYTGFVVESFVDELAHKAGEDPLIFRRRHLKPGSRESVVMDLVAEKSGWGKPLPAGTARGLAQHGSFRSYAAIVAEVRVVGDRIEIARVVAAIDCGRVINPDMVRAQMESAVIFGLTAALHSEISFKKGAVQQSNFHDYPLLRINEAPQIDVHIVPSDLDPTGVGEPGVPPVAPAVANAIFAAVGKRLRRLPLKWPT